MWSVFLVIVGTAVLFAMWNWKLFLSVVAIIIGTIIISFYTYRYFVYEAEMRQIKADLNAIPGVEVLNIWGHKDITLEEVTVRLKVAEKGELVLANLSKDVFQYPNEVYIPSIGGYSFRFIGCSGSGRFGSTIDIGSRSILGKQLGIEFKSPRDVINNYDKILAVVDSLDHVPEYNYFVDKAYEQFLFVAPFRSMDKDPIHQLFGVEGMHAYAKGLPWNNEDCFSRTVRIGYFN